MRQKPLPEILRLGPFTVHEADSANVPRSRLKAADLVIPYRGVRVSSEVSTKTISVCEAFAPLLTEHQFFSHETAASPWGFRMPRTLELIHVSAITPKHAPRMRGVIGHQLQEGHVELDVVHGLPLTSVAETWRHLATILSLDELIVAGDGLTRRKDPLATPRQLGRAVVRHRGRRGAKKLRSAFDEIRSGTDSPRETKLRLLLVRSGLPEPEVNSVIVLLDGGSTHGDLVYREQRVLVEYDGRHHATDPRQFALDVLRHESLATAGHPSPGGPPRRRPGSRGRPSSPGTRDVMTPASHPREAM